MIKLIIRKIRINTFYKEIWLQNYIKRELIFINKINLEIVKNFGTQ